MGGKGLRVTLLSGEYPPRQGGVGDYTFRLGQALAAEGVEVAVLTGRWAVAHPLPWGKLLPLVEDWGWGMWREVLKAIGELPPDILHIQYQAAAFGLHPAVNFLPWRLRGCRRRPKVVVTFHDLRVPYLFPKAGALRNWAVKKLAVGSDAAILTNQEDFERARRWGRARAYLIPIGSNIPCRLPPGYSREAWRTSLGVAPGDALLSYFGLLNASKGVEVLFRALRRLLDGGERVKLLMVGGGTGESDPANRAYAARMDALAGELELGEALIWTGFVPPQEVSAHLLASDIAVLPFREGASLRRGSLMAALEHGLAILSTRPRSLSPELVDGGNIALVPPDDPAALAEGIERLIRDTDLREGLGEGAKELSARFSWEAIARENLRVYGEVLASLGRAE